MTVMGIDILDSWQTVANITALFLHQGPNFIFARLQLLSRALRNNHQDLVHACKTTSLF